MRRRPTDAERKMWQVLRSLKALGLHFRRQAPIGPYIADFAWYGGRLVVEIDGGQHATTRESADARRSEWLQSQGYHVLRFWNHDVLKSPRSVGEAILNAARDSVPLQEDPTPNPSPQGGGERGCANGKGVALWAK